MAERPIIFRGPMVRALLAGTKTQTRRVVKPQPVRDRGVLLERCPYGAPGDLLWVRETFIHEPAGYCWEASVSIPCRPAITVYRADSEGDSRGAGWSPSIHMPRWASRITLEITGVHVERVQEISEADAMAEGAAPLLVPPDGGSTPHVEGYRALWMALHGPGSWDANPWVWVIGFRRVEVSNG